MEGKEGIALSLTAMASKLFPFLHAFLFASSSCSPLRHILPQILINNMFSETTYSFKEKCIVL